MNAVATNDRGSQSTPPTTQCRASDIFAAALEISSPGERLACLRTLCGGDEPIFLEVSGLLAAHDKLGGFLEPPETVRQKGTEGGSLTRKRFGDYELIEEIARGGMGVVFKAKQISLNRTVAVKMILSGHLASEAELRRFQSEVEAAGNLTHPNIVSIYEAGQDGGHHYYSMPLVEGESLAQLVGLGRWHSGDGKEAARLLAKVARAVHYAHEKGFLHRDLKPGNILLDRDGEPHVLDFGLAKRVSGDSSLTVSGDVIGTPSFMAPEQAAGKAKTTTADADIYSLGAILYYLLTKRPPFVADSPLDALLLVIEGEAIQPRAINPLVPADLERICVKCLEKKPEHRYASAKEFADDLERYLRGEPLTFPSLSVPNRLYGWARRQPALVSRLGGLIAVAIISEIASRSSRMVTQAQHHQVMLVLALWALASCVCQWALNKERWSETVRFVWSGVDAAFLTSALWVDHAVESPLVGLFNMWIAGSGLWLRVPVVFLSTGMAVIGYVFLLADAVHRNDPLDKWPGHWCLVFLAMLLLTGIFVAYLVHRVRVLSRFFEPRPQT